jgi:hypothetical protein
MEGSANIYETLATLLSELQKVKNLNNLANEYKAVSQNLILSLQSYLNDSREFSDSFNLYLKQTNKTVDETKNLVEKGVDTIDAAINKLNICDGNLDKKSDDLLFWVDQFEKRTASVENLYRKFLETEQKIKELIDGSLKLMMVEMDTRNKTVISHVDQSFDTSIHQLRNTHNQLSEKLNETNDNFNILIKIGDKILLSQQISEKTSSQIAQGLDTAQQHRVQIQKDIIQTLTYKFNAKQSDMANQCHRMENNICSTIKTNGKTIERELYDISTKIDKFNLMQKISIGLSAISLIVLIVLLFI